MELRNVGILSQHYTASQPRRLRLDTSPQLRASKLEPKDFFTNICHRETGESGQNVPSEASLKEHLHIRSAALRWSCLCRGEHAKLQPVATDHLESLSGVRTGSLFI